MIHDNLAHRRLAAGSNFAFKIAAKLLALYWQLIRTRYHNIQSFQWYHCRPPTTYGLAAIHVLQMPTGKEFRIGPLFDCSHIKGQKMFLEKGFTFN